MELLIVLAVMAILSAIAYPSFTLYLVKNQRLAAQQHLYHLQLLQEEWRLYHGQYTSDINELDNHLANHPHYEFSITHVSAHDYKLIATAKESSAQAQDKQAEQSCHTLSLTHSQETTPLSCWQ